ncbi:MAG TPA: N-acetylglucosamine-6-phosphate deacetylase [Planctomycetota bacterium]|jgi:N-acetylglucosamine-6-phosphate deacetylase
MQNGEIVASHYATQQGVRLRWRDGLIDSIEPTDAPPDRWLAPALLDLQVNGYAGIDFQSDSLTLEQALHAMRNLRQAGCARVFPTLVTAPWPAMLTRLHKFRELCGQSPELKTAVAGWHIEGPFLSPVPGFHGAHDPAVMLDPTPARIKELREAAGSDCVLLTLAAERPGATEAIALAVSLGITVSIGHSDASAADLEHAARAGATSFTHLGNGCPQQLDRHNNILWRVIERPELIAGIIPDRIHVSPALFRVLHRQLPQERIWYTTDAVSPAGSPPGRFRMGRIEVEVGPDQVVREPGKTNFAGSALRPLDGVIRAAQMLGRQWQQVWDNMSSVPAQMVGMDLALAPGKEATFCVIQTREDNSIVAGSTYVRGVAEELRIVPQPPSPA